MTGPMTSRLLHVASDGTRVEHPGEHIDDLEGGWYWLDVLGPTDDHAGTLASRFGLDRVTRDDLIEQQFPKYEDLERYQVFVVHALAADPTAVRTIEIDVVVGDAWIVTLHPEPVRSIDTIFGRVQRPGFALDGPFHLACRLFEFVGERYLPLLDDVDVQVLDLEEGAIDGRPEVLPDIHALRRDIALLRRSLSPQRRMLELLVRSRSESGDPAGRDLADAVDHHVHMIESLDSAHQMVATLIDTYRSATAERLNEVMKVLTVFSAIFLPLTLIAGIYGMNFLYMPELDERVAYPASLGLMLVVGVSLWVYFVRRGFIGGPKLHRMLKPARAAGRVGRGLATAAASPVLAATRIVNGHDDDGE